MEEKEELVTINTPSEVLEQKLLNTQDISEIDKIVKIFNGNLQKKALLRSNKLSDLQDIITNRMEDRILEQAEMFSNKELLEYFKIIQETISKSSINVETLEAPAIQLNQQVNINMDNKYDLESRKRIIEAIHSILNQSDTSQPMFETTEVLEQLNLDEESTDKEREEEN